MRTPLLLFILLVVAVTACRSHTDSGVGSRPDFALRAPGVDTPLPACAPAEVLEGTSEVRAQAWAAARRLKRKG
ncbi:MAG TPA: hypothetical protein VEZ71_11590, partial [Archangium sp.]|nr:hypothetical protein [Archangium sp.]